MPPRGRRPSRSRYSPYRYRTPVIRRPITPSIEIRRAQRGIPKPEPAPTPPSPMQYPNQLGSPSLPQATYFPNQPYYGTGPTGPSGTLQQPVQLPNPAEPYPWFGSTLWMRTFPPSPYVSPFSPSEPLVYTPHGPSLRAQWSHYRQTVPQERVYFTEPPATPSWPSAGYGYPSYGGGGGVVSRDAGFGLGLVNWRIGL